MFDFDWFREILATIKKNKLRTFLTAFALAWGILLLIILLSIGNGFRNGVESNFEGKAQNTITLWPGWASMPYKGLTNNRKIKFDEKTYNLIRNRIPEVEYVSARVWKNLNISYKKEYGNWNLEGVSPDIALISNIKVKGQNGRFLNQIDVEQRRKVIVINDDVKKVLFKDEDPLGKYVVAGGIAFQIIGIYDDKEDHNNPPTYIPFTTAQTLYSGGYGFGRIDFTVKGLTTEEANDEFVERLRIAMGAVHKFDAEDRSALYVRNSAKDFMQFNNIFNAISIFIVIIGVASLMAGIVGVGNIMLITVKERTREIGIRKAIGARPASILRLIILEATLITTVGGYIGIVIGVSIMEGISALLSAGGASDGPTIFKDPTVDTTTILVATVFLIVAGICAGLIPAIRATHISPIEAMRAE